MPSVPLFQVDAFADRPFAGNPAAVVPLDAWWSDAAMQAMAAENNLSETAFLGPMDETRTDADYRLRWFTPTVEVDLCGHATLASGWVVMTHLRPDLETVRFATRSGVLTVTRDGSAAEAPLSMDFPAKPPAGPSHPDPGLMEALGVAPATALEAVLDAPGAWLVVLEPASAVRALVPDFRALARVLGDRFAIVTAMAEPGGPDDFVSRVFAPGHGIDEDPVTGSAHCVLAPYWARRLEKPKVTGFQVSARGGRVGCRLHNSRVTLTGTVVPVLSGTLILPDPLPGVPNP